MRKQYYKMLSIALITTMFMTGCYKYVNVTKDNTINEEVIVTKEEQVKEDEPVSKEGNIVYRVTPEANSDIKMLNQPNAPYWFPAQLLEWNPEEAEDLDLFVSNVPLKDRVDKSKLVKSNPTQIIDFQVAALSIMNASTSGNSPHGLNRFDANTFSYWQYVDQLVYWGGSAGEGLIVPPTADVIEAAHINGVPVLGTIFLAPEAWGGKIEWLDDFLKTDDHGQFLLVDKLIEVCTVLGFDGWFINQEVGGTAKDPLTKEYADKMVSFVQQYHEKAEDKLSLMWYDSMTEEGKISYQNALTDQNDAYLIDNNGKKGAESMFLNFWWTESQLAWQDLLLKSNEKARAVGINPYDIYAGIDVQANGIMTRINWNLFQKNNVPHTSIGLYCPSWTYFAAKSIDDFERNENAMWVNEHGNPTIPTKASQYSWHGISTYAIEKTVVNQLPFITSFNKGNGYSFFINGEKVSDQDWNNRSITDVMPTYRWILNQEEGNKLKPDIDYTDAYYGGNSIRLYGAMEAAKKSELTLYSSVLVISDQTHAYAML
ncbi:MAG: glycoside hydrolase family 85, partial [Herbinix sp.]|nr:glycoside hydrolase family 85 [Herbinix sp.]